MSILEADAVKAFTLEYYDYIWIYHYEPTRIRIASKLERPVVPPEPAVELLVERMDYGFYWRIFIDEYATGGRAAISDPSEAFTLAINQPIKTGQTFLGWFESQYQPNSFLE